MAPGNSLTQIQGPSRGFWLVALAVLGLLVLTMQIGQTGSGSDLVPWVDDLNAALAAASESGQSVLVNFSALWCPGCSHMKKHVFSQQEVAQVIQKDFLPVKVDLTNPGSTHQRVAERYNVMEVPTLLILSADGSERARTGGLGAADLVDWLNQHGLSIDPHLRSNREIAAAKPL